MIDQKSLDAASLKKRIYKFVHLATGVPDPQKFLCGSGSRIPKMSTRIRFGPKGGKHQRIFMDKELPAVPFVIIHLSFAVESRKL